MCPLEQLMNSTDLSLNTENTENHLNSDMFKQLLKVQQYIKKSQISIWCDRIPEWQMFITKLLQYIFVSEKKFSTQTGIKSLEESLIYQDKIKDYFNNQEIQEQLYILFELIKQEINFKENCILKYNEHNKENYNSYSLTLPTKIQYNNISIKHKYTDNFILFKYAKFNTQTISLHNKLHNIFDFSIFYQLSNKFKLKNNV